MKTFNKEKTKTGEFLELLGLGRVKIRAISERDKTPVIKTFELSLGDVDKQLNQLKSLNDEGYDIYFMPNQGSDFSDAAIERMSSVFVDCDDPDTLNQENLNQLPPYNLKVKTFKGYHLYWLIETTTDKDSWRRCQEALIRALNTDKTIKNPARLMRLPGFDHYKGNETPNTAVDLYIRHSNKQPLDRLMAAVEGTLDTKGHDTLSGFLKSLDPAAKVKDVNCKKISDFVAQLKSGQRNVGLSNLGYALGSHSNLKLETIVEAVETGYRKTDATDWEKDRKTLENQHKKGRNNRQQHQKDRQERIAAGSKIDGVYPLHPDLEGLFPRKDSGVRGKVDADTERLLIDKMVRGRARYNTRLNCVDYFTDEWVENPNEDFLVHEVLWEYWGWAPSKEKFVQRFSGEANKPANHYDPVKEYYDNLPLLNLDDPKLKGIQDELTKYLLGIKEEDLYYRLYVKYLFLWMGHAYNRTMNPGSKADEILILQGAQGIGKSSFISWLCPISKYFSTLDVKGSNPSKDKDTIMQLHSSHIIEIDEYDKLNNKTDASTIKSLISKTDDDIRLPYARTNTKIPRKFVLMGTSNERDLLNDLTGSRRYMIIEVPENHNFWEIKPWLDDPIDEIYQTPLNDGSMMTGKDFVWSVVKTLVEEDRIQLFLNKEERSLQSSLNSNFEMEAEFSNELDELLYAWKSVPAIWGDGDRFPNHYAFTIEQLLTMFDRRSKDKGTKTKLARELRSKGFDKKRLSYGSRPVIWVHKSREDWEVRQADDDFVNTIMSKMRPLRAE